MLSGQAHENCLVSVELRRHILLQPLVEHGLVTTLENEGDNILYV